jgi:hypothetical protein
MNVKTLLLTLLASTLLGACHTKPTRVDCEDHLRPINQPAPVAKVPESVP